MTQPIIHTNTGMNHMWIHKFSTSCLGMPHNQQCNCFTSTEMKCLVITFCVSRRRRKMYCGHARLCVCLSVRGRTVTREHDSSRAWKWSRSDVDCSFVIKVTRENSVRLTLQQQRRRPSGSDQPASSSSSSNIGLLLLLLLPFIWQLTKRNSIHGVDWPKVNNVT